MEGNVSHRPIRNTPKVGGDFDPPMELGVVARREWDRIRAEAPWIQAPSAGLLALRCHAWQELLEDMASVKKRGRVQKTRNGTVKNPRLQNIREQKAFIVRADIELGLTPISQQKVSDSPGRQAIDEIEAALCG